MKTYPHSFNGRERETQTKSETMRERDGFPKYNSHTCTAQSRFIRPRKSRSARLLIWEISRKIELIQFSRKSNLEVVFDGEYRKKMVLNWSMEVEEFPDISCKPYITFLIFELYYCFLNMLLFAIWLFCLNSRWNRKLRFRKSVFIIAT